MSEWDLINLVQQLGHQFPQLGEGILGGKRSGGHCPLSEHLRFFGAFRGLFC